jgi:uncharacterized RDD family membrane protein YckC
MQPETAESAILIYFLASPKDEAVCHAIHRHLTPIVRGSTVPITVLDDFDIPAGTDRDAHHARLLDADIVLSLISADFIDDDDIYRRNQQVIDRYNRGETLMISVLVRNCLWKALPRAQQPQFPKNLQPLSNKQLWPSEDDAAMEVVNDLYDNISSMLARISSSEAETSTPGETRGMEIDLRDESSGPGLLAAATAGPGMPPGLPDEAATAMAAEAEGMATETQPDTEVEVTLPAAEAAPAQAPSPAATTFTLPRQTPAAPIKTDWRRTYYRRVVFKRAVALMLDYLILAFIPAVIYYMIRPDDGESAMWVIAAVAFYLIAPAMEASRWSATPGKRILKLQITDPTGDRISYGRAFVRNILRSITLYVYLITLGLALVPQYFRFRKSKKLFHDELSSTVIGERLATAASPAPAPATA